MLDDFSFEQPISYRTLINSVKNEKYSHAYLIETNGYSKSFDFALAFAKYLFCPNKYSNREKCKNCNQCSNIDKNEFIELKIIQPDGQWIKKSQLEELQKDFSKKSILGTKKIYIINGAEKLNASSSNSLLKFLEEPEDGIIAILLTENIYNLLDTIISRCQIISLKNNKKLLEEDTMLKLANEIYNNQESINLFIENEDNKLKLQKIMEFVNYYEENHSQTLIYVNKLWNEYFSEKEDIYNAFTIILLLYKDAFNAKLNKKIEIFTDYIQFIQNINEKNNINSLISKINVIMDLREKIKFNINPNLLMDKLIIELEGCEKK